MSESQSNRNHPGRPTLCRSCGSIIGAGETGCAVCGAPPSTSPAPSRNVAADRETIRFARAILDRPYKFTIVLLIANLFVFLVMWESSGLSAQILWQGFPEPVLIAYGAKLNSLINAPYREWWRFVTPMFVHVNLIHVLVNMYSLWVVGPYVERLYGSAKFVVFWVLTGIAGVFASYLTVRPNLTGSAFVHFLFKDQDVASAGASGALFGLVGVLFVFGIKFRHELPEGFKRAFGTGMLPIILINLFIGYLGRGFIDNAAHLGGLLSGTALALVVQFRRPGEHPGIAATWRVLQVPALGVVVVSSFKIAQRLHVYLQPSAQPVQTGNQQTALFVGYVHAMTQAQETVSAVMYDQDVSNVEAVGKSVAAVPVPDAQAAELRTRLLGILEKMAAEVALGSTPDAGPRRAPKPDRKLVDEFTSWRKDYEKWLKSATESYSSPTP